jgi:cytochrome c-type biogenesis protein CcmH
MVRRIRLLFILTFLILFALMSIKGVYASGERPPNPQKVSVYREDLLDIAKELHPPGCTDSMTADYCKLPTAFDLRSEIYEMLAQGKQKDQIMDELVAKYGERILAAPSTNGFNMLAWTLPGIGIMAGGAAIGLMVRAWVRRTSIQLTKSVATETPTLEQKKKINEELKEWL